MAVDQISFSHTDRHDAEIGKPNLLGILNRNGTLPSGKTLLEKTTAGQYVTLGQTWNKRPRAFKRT